MRIILKVMNIWTLYWLFAGLLLGTIIHLITILGLPLLSEHKAWDRIADNYQLNTMTILPRITPDTQPLPFMAPDIRYAICKYNVKKRPLLVRANLLDELWSIAIFNRQGENVYTLSGNNLKSRYVDIKISLAANDILKLGFRADDLNDQGIPVKVLEAEGLVMVRAPILSDAYVEQANINLGLAKCKTVKR